MCNKLIDLIDVSLSVQYSLSDHRYAFDKQNIHHTLLREKSKLPKRVNLRNINLLLKPLKFFPGYFCVFSALKNSF